ncbi:hypothetical protein OPV22_025493 [Ensete ventricosum]|uniref:Serine/threonine-protein kinase 11-interacting protein n=1 Tax=Ensete ventricosum TaxID=4639 RepID=A0AAV8P897_ENSVE|nr:hypothetical protein OPV22_025493 [Ensete ventricosum]
MAIVTGDRYLDRLVRFVERNAGSLLEGALTLKLNPVGLQYVHTRLEAMQELEGLLSGAPIDYLRAYVSDLGDHRALEQLRRILGLLTALKVVSVLPSPGRDPMPISLLPFGILKVLELRGCDLSTSAAKGLLELHRTLEKLICHNSTDALRHVFASRIVDIKDSPLWNKLSYLSCGCNGLVLMDESLQLLPVVETLDLSWNRIAKVDYIGKCTKLRYLDLGFNHLPTIGSLSEVSCRLVKLVLRNNALTSLHGIQNLKSLEELDLSYNIICTFTDVEILASLSSLHNLWLEGNPICCSQRYRSRVFSFFSNPEKLTLDEQGISTREYWEGHVVFACRQKKPAGYGFYLPAEDAAEDECTKIMKKKKNSRLARIEDEEQRIFNYSDQESVSCAGDSLRKELISDNESRIAGLINRAKYMKNDQSVFSLREFKEYIDQTPEEVEIKNHLTEISLSHQNIRQRKGHKTSGSNSEYVTNTAKTAEGGTSSGISESSHDAYIGDSCSNDMTRMKHSVINRGSVSLIETNLELKYEQDKLKFILIEPEKVSPLEVKLHLSPSYSTSGGHKVEDITRLTPLTAMDAIPRSQPSPVYPSSPPHYREDILHDRLCLEEEFLQQSVDSLSMGSSDSDTSSNGDASWACFLDLAQDERIMDFFHQKVLNFSAHETFEAVVCCECIFGLGTVFQECEVAILRSCTNKLYILLIDATPDGQDIAKLLGRHRFEDMREVVVGLGLQALRIYLEGNNICCLKSWEQVQVKMLETYVCEYLKMGIFFYSMLLFCHENSEGESWFTRSIFVVEGNMLVCSENFIQFGSFMDNCGSTCPYYSLDSSCAIQDILEMMRTYLLV